jgi:hypothetical protein
MKHDDAIERWFVHRGVPHFIAGYSATGDVFTRAAPLLTLIFLGELAEAFSLDFTWWQNLLAFLGAAALVAFCVAGVNRLRGRPALARPDSIGAPELAAFLLVPPLIPLVTDLQWHQTIGVFVTNLVILGVIYLGTSYGVIPIVRWAFMQAFTQVRNILDLMAKSLPLLLVFSMFIFVNADTWGISGDIPIPFLLVAIAILVAVGSLFILLRLPREMSELDTFETWPELRASTAGTPAEGLPVPESGTPDRDPLDRSERINVGLVLFFNQAVQVLLVSAAIGIFYLAFGLFIIPRTTIALWTGHPAHGLGWSPTIYGHEILVSRELLVTAGFVAAVSGLQFAIAAITDSTYREEFYQRLTVELRAALAVRAVYRRSADPVQSVGGE